MDHPVKSKIQAPAAARPRPPVAEEAAAKKKPTTLLDAYEVECIRRELERLILKQNQHAAGGGGGGGGFAAAPYAHGHHYHPRNSTKKPTSGKKVSSSPWPAATPRAAATKGRGVRLLGRHAVAICSGTVPVAAGATVVSGGVGRGRGRRRGGYREVEKV